MTLQEIIVQTEELTPEEKVQLAAHLMDQAARETSTAENEIKWMDIAGALPYPVTGMDAQEWVTRTRAEEERDLPWRAQE